MIVEDEADEVDAAVGRAGLVEGVAPAGYE
jgi:hypothetical protein